MQQSCGSGRTSPATRRRWLQLACSLPLAGTSSLWAQSSTTVRMVVPFTPGTTPDLCSRLLGPRLQALLGRSFITDNRPGASGMLGMDFVAKADADGSTLLFGTSTGLTLPFVYAKVPFDVLTAFAPVSLIGTTNFALVAHPSVPAKNMQELRAWLKSQPAPVDYASPGKGTFQHLTMEWLASLAGTKLNHVPYRGSGPAQADLLGGHVKLMIVPLHVAMPLVADNKLLLIGTTNRERDPAFPNVPTLHESGLPGMDADAWYAVWGPKGMAPELVARYGAALRTALAEPEVKGTLGKQGIAVRPSSPDELQRLSLAESAKWGQLIKDIKLPPE